MNFHLEMHQSSKLKKKTRKLVHKLGKNIFCKTDKRGFATPDGRSPAEIVVDATHGFIPLWGPNVMLRWRFQEQSMQVFVDPDAAKSYMRDLMANALLQWGDAAPVRFTEAEEAWDFEIAVSAHNNCNAHGCVLASAFFPDGGQHELLIYPKMFDQSAKEQLDTMIHEIGHIFGLRHFFANISEQDWPSEIFGDHRPFSIMNYGAQSELTALDKSDLKELYNSVWSGKLTKINGTPVRQFRPYSEARLPGNATDQQIAASTTSKKPCCCCRC